MNNDTFINETKLISKLLWKIIPFIFMAYVVSIIDRVNIGFAALSMNTDLGISASAYGVLAGIFFLAYFAFEVPSNLMMYRVGARKWITRILITWGVVVVLMGFIQNPWQLGICRVLLGIAEAGFYPAMLLYLTYWFPQKYQAKALAVFCAAIAIANVIGGPIASLIMANIDWFGIAGWRWLFILEGVPAVILGIINFFILIDCPEQAKFLSEEEKAWLAAELEKDRKTVLTKANISKWEAFKDRQVWVFCIIYLCMVTALYGLGLWLPQIVKALGKTLTTSQIGFMTSIPYIVGLIAMILVGRHSDRTKERQLHVGIPMIVAAIAFALLPNIQNFSASFILIIIATAGIYSFIGTFWTLPNMLLTGAGAAVGIALINSIGNLGGYIGPYSVGYIKDLTKSTNSAMYLLGIFALVCGILVVALPKKRFVVEESESSNFQTELLEVSDRI